MIGSNYVAIGLIVHRDHVEAFWKGTPVVRTQPVAIANGHPVYLLAGNLKNWCHIFDRDEVEDLVFLSRVYSLGSTNVFMGDGKTFVDMEVDDYHFQPVQTCEYRGDRKMLRHFAQQLKDFERVEENVLKQLGIGRGFEFPLPNKYGDPTMLPVTTEDGGEGW